MKSIYLSGLIILILLGTVLLSGCTNSNTSTAYKNYSNKYMSFQYPEGWNITEDNSSANPIVDIKKGDHTVSIQIFRNDANNISLNKEISDAMDMGYISKGYYKDNGSQTTYTVYVNEKNKNMDTLYFLKKGDNTIEIMGATGDLEFMENLVSTIKVLTG